MNTDTILRDPVFQLNILLWMSRQQPVKGYLVRPLFQEMGFTIVYIEYPFPLPEDAVRAVDASGLDISVAPEPDVLLKRDADSSALYFEAKACAFSPASSTARQARGHLLATGPAFAEVMAPIQKCMLCYVVPEANRPQMDSCLTSLNGELASHGLKPGKHSVHGLSLVGTNVVYSWDGVFKAHTGRPEDHLIVLEGVKADTDPSPLFLVFCDDDYPDPERQNMARQALQNQVYSVLLCELNLSTTSSTYTRNIDDLLHKTSDGVFQYLGRDRQRRMRRLIRENLLKRIASFWREKTPGLVQLDNDMLKVTFRDADERDKFLAWLEDYKRTSFDATKPEHEEPLPLLQMMEGSTGGNG